jgi:UDP-2-acetamido-2,6-beta-L-arabino-hexul-4-ose reductase
MKTVLVTGAAGFIGRHVCLALARTGEYQVLEFDLANAADELPALAARADCVVHLAGVNRPQVEAEFQSGNVGLTQTLCAALEASGRKATLVLSSSTQAEADNPYGRSKRAAEDVAREYGRHTGAPVRIFRFPNVFGKWSRPNYNTVVATFCHNIAHDLPVQVSNRAHEITFVYIDEVIRCLLLCLGSEPAGTAWGQVDETFRVSVGELHDLVCSFRDTRARNEVPDLGRPFVRYLYVTYLSYLEPGQRAVPVTLKTDPRGWLFELVKSPHAGQIFVSQTKPGIVRGNHYHDTKVEKFCVIQGCGRIRMRPVGGGDLVAYEVSDHPIQVVDIPAGWTHAIENTGTQDMLTIFWSSEIFDPSRPDTYAAHV